MVAKLPGDEFVLTKDGGEFLDILNLSEDQKESVAQWAVDTGLAESCDIWVGSRYDEELEDWTCFESDDLEKVLHEFDLEIEGDTVTCLETERSWIIGQEDCPLSSSRKIRGTEALHSRSRQTKPCVGDYALDLCVMAYSEDVLGLDGCYWSETMDPHRLSAPRGVIHSSRLNEWAVNPAKGFPVGYHVAPTEELENIAREGLRPMIGERSKTADEERAKIYFFPDPLSTWEALENWLGDELEDGEYALLRADLRDLCDLKREASEIATTKGISPDRLFLVNDDVFACESVEELAGAVTPLSEYVRAPSRNPR
jgi:hypothetical protein